MSIFFENLRVCEFMSSRVKNFRKTSVNYTFQQILATNFFGTLEALVLNLLKGITWKLAQYAMLVQIKIPSAWQNKEQNNLIITC